MGSAPLLLCTCAPSHQIKYVIKSNTCPPNHICAHQIIECASKALCKCARAHTCLCDVNSRPRAVPCCCPSWWQCCAAGYLLLASELVMDQWDHSVSADSVSASPTTTTENTTMITITTRRRRRRSPKMGSCRPTPTSTAECLISTQQGAEDVTATSVNVNMDLASRTHRWSL